ncbi:MAG: YciI family protein [Nocardioidaceae bacterium]
MRYMFLLYAAPDSGPAEGSPEQADEMKEWYGYSEALAGNAGMSSGEALQPSTTATTVRVRDGKTTTTDGPFAETKEVLGGWYVVDLPDLDAAIEWAAKCPLVPYGTVEVRPIQELPDQT